MNKFSAEYVASKPAGWMNRYGTPVPYANVSSNPTVRSEQGLMPIKYNYLTSISRSDNGAQIYIDKLIEEYKNSVAKHMHELDSVSQLRNLTLKEKSAIFNNTVKKVPIGSSFNTPKDVTQAVKVAKKSLGLSNNSNSNNTPAANGTVSNGWGKWLYNQTIGRCVGSKCKNTGGRRTRRAKSRCAKSRRTRRS
jgi:hypothetical protein